MPSYEESMRAKFRGESVYADSDYFVESEEDKDFEELEQPEQFEQLKESKNNNVFEIKDGEDDSANEWHVSKSYSDSRNNAWNNLDVDKISEMKTFMVSDSMFNLAGVGVGIIVILTAIYEILVYGYEEFYLYASLVGLILIIIFAIKGYKKKNNARPSKTKKIFSKKG